MQKDFPFCERAKLELAVLDVVPCVFISKRKKALFVLKIHKLHHIPAVLRITAAQLGPDCITTTQQ